MRVNCAFEESGLCFTVAIHPGPSERPVKPVYSLQLACAAITAGALLGSLGGYSVYNGPFPEFLSLLLQIMFPYPVVLFLFGFGVGAERMAALVVECVSLEMITLAMLSEGCSVLPHKKDKFPGFKECFFVLLLHSMLLCCRFRLTLTLPM